MVFWRMFENLVSGWSFEYDNDSDGLGDDWTKEGSPSTLELSTSNVKHGNNSQHCIGALDEDGFYQEISGIEENVDYTLLCWDMVTAGTLKIEVRAYNDAVYLSSPISITKTNATLALYQKNFTAPANCNNLRIYFIQNGAIVANFYIDAVGLGKKSNLSAIEVNPANFKIAKKGIAIFEKLIDGTEVKITGDVDSEITEIPVPIWTFLNQTQKNYLDSLINKRIVLINHLDEVFEFDFLAFEAEYLTEQDPQRYVYTMTLKGVNY